MGIWEYVWNSESGCVEKWLCMFMTVVSFAFLSYSFHVRFLRSLSYDENNYSHFTSKEITLYPEWPSGVPLGI